MQKACAANNLLTMAAVLGLEDGVRRKNM